MALFQMYTLEVHMFYGKTQENVKKKQMFLECGCNVARGKSIRPIIIVNVAECNKG